MVSIMSQLHRELRETGQDALGLTIDDWILALLAYAGGVIRGKTRLQKALFILNRLEEVYKQPIVPASFKPYDYGPWSPDVERALERMREKGMVETYSEPTNGEEPVTVIKASPEALERGRAVLDRLKETSAWQDIKARMHLAVHAPLLELLWYVYDIWPEYTSNSLIRRRLRLWREKKLLYPTKSFIY